MKLEKFYKKQYLGFEMFIYYPDLREREIIQIDFYVRKGIISWFWLPTKEERKISYEVYNKIKDLEIEDFDYNNDSKCLYVYII